MRRLIRESGAAIAMDSRLCDGPRDVAETQMSRLLVYQRARNIDHSSKTPGDTGAAAVDTNPLRGADHEVRT